MVYIEFVGFFRRGDSISTLVNLHICLSISASYSSSVFLGVAYTKLPFLFSVRRSYMALKTAAKSCDGRLGIVHNRFCCAAADLALNRAANCDYRYRKRIVPYSFFPCSSRNFPLNIKFYLVYLGLIMNKVKNGQNYD